MHTGGIKFNNELIVYLYKLSLLVEKEIFSMMPVSRRENEYCKKLKPFKFNFSEEDLIHIQDIILSHPEPDTIEQDLAVMPSWIRKIFARTLKTSKQ